MIGICNIQLVAQRIFLNKVYWIWRNKQKKKVSKSLSFLCYIPLWPTKRVISSYSNIFFKNDTYFLFNLLDFVCNLLYPYFPLFFKWQKKNCLIVLVCHMHVSYNFMKFISCIHAVSTLVHVNVSVYSSAMELTESYIFDWQNTFSPPLLLSLILYTSDCASRCICCNSGVTNVTESTMSDLIWHNGGWRKGISILFIYYSLLSFLFSPTPYLYLSLSLSPYYFYSHSPSLAPFLLSHTHSLFLTHYTQNG